MKTEIKEKQNDSFKSRVPKVTINPDLEKDKDKIYFPEKLARANEMLKNAKLPPSLNAHRKL